MVLDIDLLRPEKGGNPDLVRQSEKNRFKDATVIDRIIDLDNEWRKARYTGDQLNRLRNACGKAVGERKKAKEADGEDLPIPESLTANPAEVKPEDLKILSVLQLKSYGRFIGETIVKNEHIIDQLKNDRDNLLREVGNLLHKDVVVSDNEDNNAIIRQHGDVTTRYQYSHVDLVTMIDGFDGERGTRTAGGRGYYLKGPCVFLEQALMQLGLHLLLDEGYEALLTPYFMRKDAMQAVAQLNQFDEELYKVIGKRSDVKGDAELEEKYLIATSEQPIAAFHRGEWLNPATLPLKYAGISACFRQEVGSHGRDTRGIFRVHQFHKVEQFCITSPLDGASEAMFASMVANAEKFYQLLGIPYRVVSIVSGELNNAAAIKHDLEGWFPGSGAFRELVSCSNCTDYQARSLQVHFGQTKKQNDEAPYVHMLNGTMCATTRTICAILENCQESDGIRVPEALRHLMPAKYREKIPFVKPPPVVEKVAESK
ncbi:hypothetical protein BOX15_Mlig012611g2 [Macrostomum lignano]|uniref:Uncharacterized protein n=2 Tax=Macrostomum lignano TaxID=282301 RepID=A0A267H2K0_9PLAT|nr:hypothetical protein BOX15_Mlig012611g2 [Macrostomum lignano]